MNKAISIVALSLITNLLITNYCVSQSRLSQLFASGNYKECIVVSDSLLKFDNKNPVANFFKGASLVNLKDYKKAEEYLIYARTYQYTPTIAVNAHLLRMYAGMKNKDALIAELSSLVKNGFAAMSYLNRIQEFQYLNDDPDFMKMKKLVDVNARPCIYREEYKRLDFWIGHWDVMVNGNKYADSYITKSQDGCTLYEDYRTLRGFLGNSTNYFDTADSLYKQLWIAGTNSIIRYQEVEFRDGYLRMESPGVTRMTWVYDSIKDEVLQSAENTSDGGKTWTPGFTGLYVRKGKDYMRDEINQVLLKMEELFSQNKMSEIADHYTVDAQILEPGGRVYSGAYEIKSYWKELEGKGISWDLELLEVESSDDLISTIVISILKHTLSGKEELSKTKALIIWKKTPNGYKIHKDFFQPIR